jgi:hypothetical protein
MADPPLAENPGPATNYNKAIVSYDGGYFAF